MANDEHTKTEAEGQPPETDDTTSAVQEATDAAESAEEAVVDLEEAEVTLEHLQEELTAAKDAALRAQAEAQNARRRAEQDVEKARKFALERFSGDLLPVVDNLERGLEAAGADGASLESVTDGVELTLKGLLDVLGKFHIEVVDPVGEPFDPEFHQAMSMVESHDAEPNSVLFVMQKGYLLSGRLLRPAMVTVSKAPAAEG